MVSSPIKFEDLPALQNIDQDFKDKYVTLMYKLLEEGYEFKPYDGLRTSDTQARYWRQSRTREQVLQEIDRLRSLRCEYLAHVIERVGPQKNGMWLTNAIPGLSWHNHGRAVDALWVKFKGKPAPKRNQEGYKRKAELARGLGLHSGYFWRKQDSVHIQKNLENPSKIYTLQELNEALSEYDSKRL